MNRMLLLLAGAAALLASAVASAAGSAEILLQNGERVRIEWLGPDRIRVDGRSTMVPGYLLVRDGRPYVVMQQFGQPLAVELSAMREVLPEETLQDMTGHGILVLDRLAPTGERETVSGIDGEVHKLRFTDRHGQSRETDMVVARDPLLRELTEILEVVGTAVARDLQRDIPHGERVLAELLRREALGVLRVGGDARLQALDGAAPPASRFDTPDGLFRVPGRGRLDDARHGDATPAS